MEAAVQSSGLGSVVKEERMESNARNENLGEAGKVGNGHEDNNTKPSSPNQKEKDISTSKQVPLVTAIERSPMDTVSRASSSMKMAQDQLESARAEMGKVREENKVLKTTLARIMKEYQYLQMHLTNSPQLEVAKKPTDIDPGHQEIEEPEFVSLTLGRDSSEPKKDEKNSNPGKGKENEQLKEGLALRLDCKFEGSNLGSPEPASNPSPENSFEEPKEEEAGETWPPSKILKTMRSGVGEASQQTNIKRARVSVRARCDTPTMNDGCQWRKYGQKIAKGNPCPRAYYRCTVAPACPVRKQVQRFAEDMTILITTYEGTHNHPLPMSATAMASTTSAAACMLMTGSSSSGSAAGASATNTTSANLHGLNFNLSDNTRSRQFYLPNTSISSSPSYPTITLDLTAPPSSSSAPSSQINRLSSSFDPSSRYSSTSFNFSSSESNSLPTSWGNGYLSYGATHPYNKNQIGSLNLGRQPQEHFYQPYMQTSQPTPPQQSLTETIAAATKAITLDPSFRSVLEAAITSIVNKDSRENFGQNSKWNEPLAPISSYSSAPNGNGHASSYLN